MGAITISSSGFGPLPVAAPAGWPVGVVWPGNGTVAPNGQRQATLTDAEMLQLFTWAAATQIPQGTATQPASTTIAAVLVAWVGTFFRGTIQAIQQYFTGAPSVPPPINLN